MSWIRRYFPQIALYSLLAIAAFEMRGQRIFLGPLSFYITTARLAIGLYCLTTIPWFLKKGWPTLWAGQRTLVISSICLWAAAALSTLASAYPSVALERLIFYSSFLYLFWLGLSLNFPKLWSHLPLFFFLLGVIEACLGIPEYFLPNVKTLVAGAFIKSPDGSIALFGSPDGRAYSCGSFQNNIIYGTFAVLALTFGWIRRPALPIYCLIPASSLLIAAVVVSGSRLAALGLCLLLAFQILKGIYLKHGRLLIMGSLGAALFAAVFAYHGPPKLKRDVLGFRSHFSSTNAFNFYSSGRLMIWGAACRIWRDHPLLGVGPGVYGHHLADYKRYEYLNDQGLHQHPHNIVLRSLCETGLLGLAAFAVFAYHLTRRILASNSRNYAWPLLLWVFFEMFEEFLRDAFPCVMLLAMLMLTMSKSELEVRRDSSI